MWIPPAHSASADVSRSPEGQGRSSPNGSSRSPRPSTRPSRVYIEQFRAEGHIREEAVVEAGAVRLRPILMTSLTTGAGMLPLALGIGEGSALMQPLAIAVVGGLAVSTLQTLAMVPSAYLVLHGGGTG